MKQAYVQTKGNAEHSVSGEESSPEDDAANNTESNIESITKSSIYYGNKIGHKSYVEIKVNISKAKNIIINAKDSFKAKRFIQSIKNQRSNNEIKTIESNDKGIKQSVCYSGSKTIKQSKKVSTKAMEKSVKTAEQTFKLPIKNITTPLNYQNYQLNLLSQALKL